MDSQKMDDVSLETKQVAKDENNNIVEAPISEVDNKTFRKSDSQIKKTEPKQKTKESILMYNNEHEYSKRNLKKVRSKKKNRRFENLCYLLKLFNDDIIDHDDDDIDFIDFNSSIFYELLQNKPLLEKWYKFMSQTGEEQDKILRDLDRQQSEPKHQLDHDSKEINESLTFGIRAYNKIDKNIRPVLKRQYSKDYILKYENEIMDLLQSSNAMKDEYHIDNINQKFERMIVHGVCQYLDLCSKSIKQGDNTMMEIKTSTGHFLIPPILLSEFLEKNINKL